MQDAIKVTSLIKDYFEGSSVVKRALDNLNLSIPKGKIFGLLGPNGAGKSTLINILAGTIKKTSGNVCIMDVSIDEYPKNARSQIGIVPQEIVYDTFFPIFDALEFYAGYYGIKPSNRKTEDILKALSLWDKRNSYPQSLSGGMKRRFLIAKAMVHSPPVLVLDEPTAGVDIELRDQLWKYIKNLKNQGVTVIITTHYLTEAQELCDEIAFINNGIIVKQDSKNKILDSLGTKYIEFTFSNPVNPRNIGEKYEFISPNKIRFYIDQGKTNYYKMLETIKDLGDEIVDVHTANPDLEIIFQQVMNSSKNI